MYLRKSTIEMCGNITPTGIKQINFLIICNNYEIYRLVRRGFNGHIIAI